MQTIAIAEQEPQPEAPEQEATALAPTEPEVIEGEIVVIEPPESTEDHTPPKQKPYWLLVPCTILFCLIFLAGSFLLPVFNTTATITLIPVERSITTTATIQIPGRLLPALTLSQSATVVATGKHRQDATRAIGTITLYNGLLTSQPIAAGTILTGSDGIQVVTDQPARVPAATPPIEGQITIPAHARIPGSQGNIPSYDINQACCATSVFAKNIRVFTGGAQARDVLVVRREDITDAASPLQTSLSKSEHAALQAQLHPGEALITPSCSPHVLSDHQPGNEAREVTVTVSETCGGFAYDAQKIYANAMQMIHAETTKNLGTGYSLMGDLQVSILHATITDQARGIATLAQKLDMTYVYQLSPGEKQHLVKLLAGKTKQQAINTLLQFPGIQTASIHLTGGNTALPADPNHIQIIVVYQPS